MNNCIERYNPAQLPALTRLLDDSFEIQNADKEQLIRWKFFDDFHRGGTVTYVALDDAGNVVSQYTNFPIPIRDGPRLLSGMICADMATHPDFRGKGLISQLSRQVYADVIAQNAALSIGFSNDEGVKVDQHANGYGYKIVGEFMRYGKIIVRRRSTPYTLQRTDTFSEPIYTAGMNFVRIDKSLEYLNWRYLRKPNHDYQVYRLIRGTCFAGYVVLRQSGYKYHVYDLITTSENSSDLQNILTATHNLIFELGTRVAIHYVLDNPFWRQVLRGCLRLPRGVTTYYLTVKIHPACFNGGERLTQASQWVLMAGDIL